MNNDAFSYLNLNNNISDIFFEENSSIFILVQFIRGKTAAPGSRARAHTARHLPTKMLTKRVPEGWKIFFTSEITPAKDLPWKPNKDVNISWFYY